MKILCSFFLVAITFQSFAQNGEVMKGNRYYKDSAYDQAEDMYRKSISKKPTTAAQFNLGNTLYKKQKTEEAIQQYDATAVLSTDATIKAGALYNKGVVYHRNQQLDEAIEAYKQALRLTPDDAVIRKNLQLALITRRQQNPEQKPKEQKKQEQQNQDKKKKEEPPPQSKISKKQAEQYLKSLTEKERQLQEKLQKKTGVPSQPDKDW